MGNKISEWEKIRGLSNESEGWMATRLMADDTCNIIYEVIGNSKKGYVGYAENNVSGFRREAVKDHYQTTGTRYKNPFKLMERIGNGSQLWLCIDFCNCIGDYTKTIDE